MIRQFLGTILRVFALALVWANVAGFFHYVLLGQYNGGYYRGGAEIWLLGIALFIGGMIVSDRVIRLRVSFGGQEAIPAARKVAAIEPETLRLRDMIALLDEDDLADLRAEVREGLRDRIRNLTADESESFEDLLADAGPKRKRGAS